MSDVISRVYSREALKTITIIAAVYGVQVGLQKDLFRCPRQNHEFYGLSFLLTPAILLFGLSLVVSRRSRSVVTTCMQHDDHKVKCNYFLNSLVDFFRPFVAPVSWMITALLRGDYYVCIRRGQQTNAVDFDLIYTQSFILGTACLVAMVIFSVGIVCIQRYCTNNSRLLPTYDELADLKEEAIFRAFEEKMEMVAREFAESVVERAFSSRNSDIGMDQRFLLARERVMNMYEHKRVNEYTIDCPMNRLDSMEFTSTTTM